MLKHMIIALAALGVGIAGLSAGGASAFPVQSAPAIEAGSATLLTEVHSRYQNNRVVPYNRNLHGNRCGSWRNNCRYRHGGNYYQNQWWLLPAVGAGIALGAAGTYNNGYHAGGYGRKHVAWCLDHYRSYNPRTNRWMSRNGYARQCVSPYRY